jgi:peroxiredoxin
MDCIFTKRQNYSIMTHLKIGDQAPDFEAIDQSGNTSETKRL